MTAALTDVYMQIYAYVQVNMYISVYTWKFICTHVYFMKNVAMHRFVTFSCAPGLFIDREIVCPLDGSLFLQTELRIFSLVAYIHVNMSICVRDCACMELLEVHLLTRSLWDTKSFAP